MEEMTCCPLTGYCDGEEPKYFSRTHPVARKATTCTECGGKIGKGETYERDRGKWFGKWDLNRACMLCVEIRNHFACDGWIYGQLWEDLETNFFPDMKAGGPCMEGLSPEAKRKLVDARMEWFFGNGEWDDDAWEGWAERRPKP